MNNPADTLAALAADIERAGQTAPFILDNTAFAISPSEIDEWVSRLRALASLKGEAEPVAWVSAGGSALDFVRHYQDDRPLIYGDTAPPAPQAVGEQGYTLVPTVMLALAKDGASHPAVRKFAAGCLDSALSTPSPAPQGGGEAICEALVNLVEGHPVHRWAADGVRLKDTPEWVAFYNLVRRLK